MVIAKNILTLIKIILHIALKSVRNWPKSRNARKKVWVSQREILNSLRWGKIEEEFNFRRRIRDEISQLEKQKSIGSWQQMFQIRQNIMKLNYQKGIENRAGNVRLIGDIATSQFGHTIMLADRLRAIHLGLTDYRYVLVTDSFANKHLIFEYFNDAIPVLVQPRDSYDAIHTLWPYLFEDMHIQELQGEFLSYEQAHNTLTSEYEKQFGGKPLLSLKETTQNVGETFLKESEIGFESKYVTLHIRNSGTQSIRNADPSTYVHAIRKLLDMGIYVILIGGNEAPRFNLQHEYFFDYAHSKWKNEICDIFLLATCYFHIGTQSGVSEIPAMFGRSVLITNAMRFGFHYGISNSLMIPRIVKRTNKIPFVGNFTDDLNSGLYDFDYLRNQECNLLYRDNSSDEITEGCLELVNPSNPKTTIQEQIKNQLELRSFKGLTYMSDYFLRRHKNYFQNGRQDA